MWLHASSGDDARIPAREDFRLPFNDQIPHFLYDLQAISLLQGSFEKQQV